MQKFMCAAGSRCNATLTSICNVSDVFTMSTEGPPHSFFCNQYESLYGVITVTKLDDGFKTIRIGTTSREFSWFPGYNKTLLFITDYCNN